MRGIQQSCQLASAELLLAVFKVALGLLELTNCDLVEAHADQVVGINLRNRVCFLDKLKSTLTMELALMRVELILSEVQLVPS